MCAPGYSVGKWHRHLAGSVADVRLPECLRSLYLRLREHVSSSQPLTGYKARKLLHGDLNAVL